MDAECTYDNVIAIRAVGSSDGMTADWVKLPCKLRENISPGIINEARGVYDIVFPHRAQSNVNKTGV